MDPRVIAKAARVGNFIERLLAKVRPGRDGPTSKQLRIIPYRSLGDERELTVRGRVVRMAPTRPRHASDRGAVPAREHLAAVYRAFDVLEVPHATLEASSGDMSATGQSDEGGYFTIALPAPAERAWTGGWHHATVRLLDAQEDDTSAATFGRALPHTLSVVDVFVPLAGATLAIVSDLDDTAMDTHTTRTFRMLRTVLFRSALRRRAVPGIPALYRALQCGVAGDACNPLCYISSSAANLYDAIVDYLDAHELPRGPVFLHDWGSRQRSFHTVEFEHKGAYVGTMIDRFPTLPFLLIGDDVNEDPEMYAMLATQRPGRVAAIWIRSLLSDPLRTRQLEHLRTSLRAHGTELLVAADTSAFVSAARSRGWIAPE